MKSLRVISVLCLVIYSGNSWPDTEFEDTVPVELADALLNNVGIGGTGLYSDILSSFPAFNVPAGFEVLGSAGRGFSQSVVLSTQLAEAQARTAIEDSFSAQGFSRYEPPGMNTANVGFVGSAAVPISANRRWCHDDHGHLSLFFNENPSTNVLVLRLTSGNIQQSCGEQLAQEASATVGYGSEILLRQYLPRLQVPDVSTLPAPAQALMFSGSARDGVDSDYTLAIDWSMEQVYQHFAEQIENQGWQLDSQAIGQVSATGIWTKSPDPDLSLLGTLSVFSNDDANFDLKFNLRKP